MRDKVTELARVREELLDKFRVNVKISWGSKHDTSETGLSTYRASDVVLVARPHKPTYLVDVWAGPWKVVLEGRHVHAVEELPSAGRGKTHVSRMRPYSHPPLDVTVELKEAASRIRPKGNSRWMTFSILSFGLWLM